MRLRRQLRLLCFNVSAPLYAGESAVLPSLSSYSLLIPYYWFGDAAHGLSAMLVVWTLYSDCVL